MQFANVNGERREAMPGMNGICPMCGASVIARCGTLRVWHWAHRGLRECDPWRENETAWHRRWKGRFPQAWQEIIAFDHSGERHIADVRTDSHTVVEFQHSRLDPVERAARERFYGDMVWVVDGTRLKRDWARFEKAHCELVLVKQGTFVLRSPADHLP